MVIFKVSTFVVKPDKREEFLTLIKKWIASTEKNKCMHAKVFSVMG